MSRYSDEFFFTFFNRTLLKKNTALRQSLARVRLSRESFKNRLKTTATWNRNMENGQRSVKVSLFVYFYDKESAEWSEMQL